MVHLIDEPVKSGWTPHGTLQVQVYPVPESTLGQTSARIKKAFGTATQAANEHKLLIDYARLKRMVENPDSLPHALLLEGLPFDVLPQPPKTFYDQLMKHQALYSQVNTAQQ